MADQATTTAATTPGEAAPETTDEHQPDTGDQGLAPAAARPADTGLAVPGKGTTIARSFAGLMPQTIGEAFMLSTYLAKSNAIPRSLMGKPESILTVIMAGIEIGLTPIRALQSITNISGTLCMKADLQLALVQRSTVLSFYEESFEVKGKTDTNLAKRLALALKPTGLDDDAVALAIEKIQAAATDLKPDNPYAWAMGIRQGTTQLQIRTFTYADAMKAVIYEASDDGAKEKKPLAEKFNYKSFPGDMYPKRARTRVLQVLASEVTAGLPAAEAIEGGQVIEAEFVHAAPSTSGQGDNVTQLMVDLQATNADLALSIQKAFEELKLAPARQLQLLTQFKGKPEDLQTWCRDEYARRRGAPAAPPKGSGTGKKKTAGKPKAGASHPDGPAKAATTTTETKQPDAPKPEPVKAEPTMAEKMKAAVTKKTPSGSF